MSITKARMYKTAFVTVGIMNGKCVGLINAYVGYGGVIYFTTCDGMQYSEHELTRFVL